jgi:hypothetical protein
MGRVLLDPLRVGPRIRRVSLDSGPWDEPELDEEEPSGESSSWLSDSEGEPLSGVLVGSDEGPDGALTLSAAGIVLGVSARRVRQFVEEGRLDVVGTKPLTVTRESVERIAHKRAEETGQAVAVRPGRAVPAGDLAAVVDLIRAEHAATLAALDARSSDLAAHRDALAAQVKDLRAEARRERAEVARQRAETDRERERADVLAVEVERLRASPPPRFWGRSRP